MKSADNKPKKELRRLKKPILSFILGVLVATGLSNVTPLSPTIDYAAGMGFVSGIVVIMLFFKEFTNLRLIFLGASVTSLVFAFHTFFFSLVSNGLIQIQFDSLWGLFKSVLLTSLFSLLERFTKLVEERTAKK